MHKLNTKLAKPFTIGVTGLLLFCGMLMPLGAGCNNNQSHKYNETISYSITLHRWDIYEVITVYQNGDDALKERITLDLCYLLGYDENDTRSSGIQWYMEKAEGLLNDKIMSIHMGKKIFLNTLRSKAEFMHLEESYGEVEAYHIIAERMFQEELKEFKVKYGGGWYK